MDAADAPRATSMTIRVIRRCAAFLAVFLAVFLVAACSGLLGPRTLLITPTDLQQQLAGHFPIDKQVLGVYDVSIQPPSLSFRAEGGRIATTLPLMMRNALNGREWHGTLTAEFGLQLDATHQALQLTNVTVSALQIDGLPPAMDQILTNVGSTVVADQLNGKVIYRLRDNDLRRANQMGYTLAGIDVTGDGVAVRLVPTS